MIIDTHTHYYDPSRPEGVPWPDPNDDVLYRRVLPDDFKALAVPEGVAGTVVVEASPWLEDNQWILDLAADEPFIVGFVGNLDIGDDAFVQRLDRFAANPLYRGIRTHASRLVGSATNASLAPLRALAERDLQLDLLLRPDDLSTVASVAAEAPDLRIVLDHLAGVRIDGAAPNADWVAGIQSVGERENVYMKVSALVESADDTPPPDDVAYYAPTLDALWSAFGVDRLIYGSNWPVSERYAPYPTVQRIVDEYFSGKGQEARRKYFRDNSRAAYRWIDRT